MTAPEQCPICHQPRTFEEMSAREALRSELIVQGLQLTSAYEPVVAAARAWVDAIRDHPNCWAGSEDHALIAAVKALDGKTYDWETDRAGT